MPRSTPSAYSQRGLLGEHRHTHAEGGGIGVRDLKPTPSGALIVEIANRDMPGYIDGAINVIDVEDVARAHLSAETNGRAGERYILGNENTTVRDFFQLVAR